MACLIAVEQDIITADDLNGAIKAGSPAGLDVSYLVRSCEEFLPQEEMGRDGFDGYAYNM